MSSYKPLNYLHRSISQHYKKLLITIHKLYPLQFTNELLNYYYQHIKKNMKFYKLSELRTNILKIRVKRKQFKKIIKERGIQLHTKNAVDAENRCRARIWGAGKMITLDDGKVVYGDRCYRRFKDETTKLCFQHSFKNSHGNYDEEPINEIIYNFKKFSVFMKSKN